MKAWVRLTAAALLLVVAAAPVAVADSEDCREAVQSYESALNDVSYALQQYGRCLSNSEGQDDCSSEFSRLRSAHSDFESAVSDYQAECH